MNNNTVKKVLKAICFYFRKLLETHFWDDSTPKIFVTLDCPIIEDGLKGRTEVQPLQNRDGETHPQEGISENNAAAEAAAIKNHSPNLTKDAKMIPQ